jgi:uncharacterized protein (DUF58 family)
MTRHRSSWFTVLGWAALMLIVWALFVPKGLSVGTFTLLGFTGALLLIGSSMLWQVQRPAPSVREIRAALDAGERQETGQ